MVPKIPSLIDRIYSLKPNQINTIFNRIKKWRNTLYSNSRINKALAINIIKQSYEISLLPVPLIFFVRGMKEAIGIIDMQNYSNINYIEYRQLRLNLFFLSLDKETRDYIYVEQEVSSNLLIQEGLIFEDICYNLYDNFYKLFDKILDIYTPELINIDLFKVNNCYLQYCIEEFQPIYNAQAWGILEILNQECPFLFGLSDICVVMERPIEISLNNEQFPHAQNKPAMIFEDGSEFYYYHGVSVPECYGKTPTYSWQPQWILDEIDEYNRSILIYNIGYKKLNDKFPEYDFWQDRVLLLCESVDTIINWQLYHHNQLYLKQQQTDELKINPDNAIKIINILPFKLPTELSNLYQYYNGGYQLAPGLYFYPIKQAIQALSNLDWIKSDTGYPFPLFRGARDEIYYVLADDPEPTYSHVYCIFPGEEPIVYAECVTSLIVTIAQCYQEGAYYIAIDEKTGDRSIQQDLDKIEPIFEKFNPDQIDTWRKIWKS
jgi:hypothetical protein